MCWIGWGWIGLDWIGSGWIWSDWVRSGWTPPRPANFQTFQPHHSTWPNPSPIIPTNPTPNNPRQSTPPRPAHSPPKHDQSDIPKHYIKIDIWKYLEKDKNIKLQRQNDATSSNIAEYFQSNVILSMGFRIWDSTSVCCFCVLEAYLRRG